MVSLEQKVQELILRHTEEDWFEFKENWYEAHPIGEYISSLSNAALLANQEYGYLIWGVNDDTFELTDTSFTWKNKNINKEPLEHYLARLITPDTNFQFHEIYNSGKRLVVLEIPAAKQVPTAFDGVRYLRIGSSKVNLAKFPEREAFLFRILNYGYPSLVNIDSITQDLSFTTLETIYASHQIPLNLDSYKTNLRFYTENGMYNKLAQLLSDNSYIPIRVSLFKGKDKTSPLYSVREFGNQCILTSLLKVLDFGTVLNVPVANEEGRVMIREEVNLFSMQAYREAVINAFVHNHWIEGNGPSLSVYSDRIEILSRGTMAPAQSMEGFFLGESVPVNKELADIFLQTHISERSGRGVPVITHEYGRKAFLFHENTIVVTIPFQQEVNGFGSGAEEPDKDSQKGKELDDIDKKIINLLKKDPRMTQPLLAAEIGCSLSSIQYHVRHLRQKGILTRVGGRRDGAWEIHLPE